MAIRLDHGDDELAETHEINVTPFIDVILVLLIIFMVAAPLATVDVPVNLPASAAKPRERPDKPVFLTVKADLTLVLGTTPVAGEGLAGELERLSGGDRATPILLRADKAVAYGDLMGVMNLLMDAGYAKVVLIGLDRGEVM